jgi:hypothetical protein
MRPANDRQPDPDHPEPLLQGLIRILENSSNDVGKAISGLRRVFSALPAPWHCRERTLDLRVATRAADTLWPEAADTMRAPQIMVACAEIRGLPARGNQSMTRGGMRSQTGLS